ncbi:MAG: glycosyltransferase 87 family protein [Dehalococcoidia bacterium]
MRHDGDELGGTTRASGREVFAGVAAGPVAVVMFVASCIAVDGGLGRGSLRGDVGYYASIAERVRGGAIPYHDFYLEYPPGALPVFVFPEALPGLSYTTWFNLLMTACGAGSILCARLVLRRLGAGLSRTMFALGTMSVSPLLLGSIMINRYDLVLALLLTATLALLLSDRVGWSSATLAIAFVAKLLPLLLIPVIAVRVARSSGRRALVRALLIFAGLSAAVFVPFASIAFGGVGFSIWSQTRRDLHIESFGASVLLAADKMGFYEAQWVWGAPAQIDLAGALPDAVGVLSTLVQLCALAAVVIAFARGAADAERLVAAFVAGVTALLVLGKVLSPQFLVWLVPLVPLLCGRIGRTAIVLLAGALIVTQVESAHDRDVGSGLRGGDWTVWALLGRNMLLVGIFVLAFLQLRQLTPVGRGSAQPLDPADKDLR